MIARIGVSYFLLGKEVKEISITKSSCTDRPEMEPVTLGLLNADAFTSSIIWAIQIESIKNILCIYICPINLCD